MNITQNATRRKYRIHSTNANGAPVCGGGNAARTAQWQQVILATDCQRCAQILKRRYHQQTKEQNDACR
jgi:hypothetical protein